jgi:hypothetical protein
MDGARVAGLEGIPYNLPLFYGPKTILLAVRLRRLMLEEYRVRRDTGRLLGQVLPRAHSPDRVEKGTAW